MTYMFEDSEGAFINRDSFGDHSRIESGGLHWTQAGRGVLHEEIPEHSGQDCHGLQMWVNHASKDRMAEVRAWNLDAHEIPEVKPSEGVRIRVLVGKAFGTKAAFEPLVPITLLDVYVNPHTSFTCEVADDYRAFALLIKGQGVFGSESTPLEAHSAALFGQEGTSITARGGSEGLHFLLATGKPYHEDFVFGGPFVADNHEQILEMRQRFQKGDMGRLEPSPLFER
jgi:redox-sensitive bicupin YhaK (pirin superfamily)